MGDELMTKAANINDADLDRFYPWHSALERAFDEAKKLISEGAEDGKYFIDGKDLYISITTYVSRLRSAGKMETHKDYIDVQIILEGEEIIALADANTLVGTVPYNAEKDIEYYALGENYTEARLGKGDFLIIFPTQAHAPNLSINETPSDVRKMVIKIKA